MKLSEEQEYVLISMFLDDKKDTAYHCGTTMRTMYSLLNRSLIRRTNYDEPVWFDFATTSISFELTAVGKETAKRFIEEAKNIEVTPDDFYDAYMYCLDHGIYADVYGRKHAAVAEEHLAVLIDLYHALKRKFPKLTIVRFHELLTIAAFHYTNWDGYRVSLNRGIIGGVMMEKQSEVKFVHPSGFKFFYMVRIDKNAP